MRVQYLTGLVMLSGTCTNTFGESIPDILEVYCRLNGQSWSALGIPSFHRMQGTRWLFSENVFWAIIRGNVCVFDFNSKRHISSFCKYGFLLRLIANYRENTDLKHAEIMVTPTHILQSCSHNFGILIQGGLTIPSYYHNFSTKLIKALCCTYLVRCVTQML